MERKADKGAEILWAISDALGAGQCWCAGNTSLPMFYRVFMVCVRVSWSAALNACTLQKLSVPMWAMRVCIPAHFHPDSLCAAVCGEIIAAFVLHLCRSLGPADSPSRSALTVASGIASQAVLSCIKSRHMVSQQSIFRWMYVHAHSVTQIHGRAEKVDKNIRVTRTVSIRFSSKTNCRPCAQYSVRSRHWNTLHHDRGEPLVRIRNKQKKKKRRFRQKAQK